LVVSMAIVTNVPKERDAAWAIMCKYVTQVVTITNGKIAPYAPMVVTMDSAITVCRARNAVHLITPNPANLRPVVTTGTLGSCAQMAATAKVIVINAY
jgi:hypothetical protein